MGFGSFEVICAHANVPLCNLVSRPGPVGSTVLQYTGIASSCYARSVNIANTIIFQVGSDFIHIGGLAVIVMILFNLRAKHTAVGLIEMTHFFRGFFGLTLLSLLIDSGAIPLGSAVYPYFVAAQCGLISSLCMCLFLNGLLYFQLYRDGTRKSVFVFRSICLCAFALTFVVALLTFKGWGSLNQRETTALFVVLYVLNIVILLAYVISQICLSVFVLQDYWAFGAFMLGLLFFVVGQVLLYALSATICHKIKHYLDGVFFATLCNLFAVMMVYKYWDMITIDDTEFSISPKNNLGDIKEPFDDINGSEYAASTLALNSHAF